jgi:hypothetical protein
VLEPAEIDRHDEILRSVVAHNARRRAQRDRAARNKHYARLATRLAVPVAFGVGVYFIVVLMSGVLGLGKSSDGGQTAAAAPPPAEASTPTPTAAPKPKTKPTTAQHVAAPKAIEHRSVRSTAKVPPTKEPVTASIASVSPKTTTTTAAKTTTKPHHAAAKTTTKPHHAAATSQPPVVLAEAVPSKGTRATSLEAEIPPAGVATFTIAATRGAAFVEIRSKTRSGALITKGLVPKGETITFSNKALWVHVGSPQNLDLSVNGRPWRPTGSTVVATLTATGVHR